MLHKLIPTVVVGAGGGGSVDHVRVGSQPVVKAAATAMNAEVVGVTTAADVVRCKALNRDLLIFDPDAMLTVAQRP